MKVVYLAGPYRGSNAWEIEQNVRKAEGEALRLWQAGYAVICPQANTRFYNGAAPDNVWLEGDIEILKRCDYLVLMDGVPLSKGVIRELCVAKEENIPVRLVSELLA